MKRRKVALFMAAVITCTQVMSTGMPLSAEEALSEEPVISADTVESAPEPEEEMTAEFQEDEQKAVPGVEAPEEEGQISEEPGETEDSVQDKPEEIYPDAADWDGLIIDEEAGQETETVQETLAEEEPREETEAAEEQLFETEEEQVQMLASDEENGYEVRIENLRDDGWTWMYTNEEAYTLTARVDGLSETDTYSVEWAVGVWNEEENSMDPVESESGIWSFSEDTCSITLDGKELPGECSVDVCAQVTVHSEENNDSELEDHWFRVDVCNPRYEYDFPNCGSQLPERWLSIDKTMRCYIEDGAHPWGNDWNDTVEITNVSVKVDMKNSESENAVDVTKWSDENGSGWVVYMHDYGHAWVTVEYDPAKGDPAEYEPYVFDVWVGGSVYNMSADSNTGTDQLLPGASLNLNLSVWQDCYDRENGHYPGDVSDVTVEFTCEDESWQDVVAVEPQDDPMDYRVTANPKAAGRQVLLQFRAYVPDEESQDGRCEVAYTDYRVYVNDGYFQLFAADLEDLNELRSLEPGQTSSITPQLCRFDSENRDGSEVTEQVLYRWEWDEQALQITDVKGNVLNGEDPWGTAPFTVKKLQNRETDARLIADMQDDEEGNHSERARLNLKFDELDYNTGFERLRGGDCTWVFNGEDLVLSLDMSNLQYRNKYEVDWSVGKWDEATQSVVNTEAYNDVYKVNEGNHSITIYGGELAEVISEDSWINVEARIMVNRGTEKNPEWIEVAGTGTGVQLREIHFEYQYPCSDPGEDTMLQGGDISISRSMNCTVSDPEHDYQDVEVPITSVEIIEQGTWDENGEMKPSGDTIVTLEERPGEGWNLHGEDFGYADILVTYKSAETGYEEKKEIRVYVVGDYYRLEWYYPDNTDCMLAGSEMDVEVKLRYEYLDKEGYHCEYPADYQLEIVRDEDGNPCYDTNLVNAQIVQNDEDSTWHLQVSSTDRNNQWGTHIWVRALINDNGEYTEVFSNGIWVNVTGGYHYMTINGEPYSHMLLGKELKLVDYNPIVWLRELDCDDREAENIRFSLEYDENAWQVTDDSGKIPVLKRVGPWGTSVRLVAEESYEDENGETGWNRVSDREFWFDDLGYWVGLDFSYGSWENNICYYDKPLVLTLDTEGLGEQTGYTVDWKLSGLYESEISEKYAKVSEDGKKVTIFADSDKNGLNIRAAVNYEGNEICSTDMTWIWFCEPTVDYQLPGDENLLPGWDFWINRNYNLHVENGDYPDGQDFEVTIQSVTVQDAEEYSHVLSYEDNGDENPAADENGNWRLRGNRNGYASVTLTCTSDFDSEPYYHTLWLNVTGDVFRLDGIYPDGFDHMLCGQQMTIDTSLWLDQYDVDLDEYRSGKVEDYTLELAEDVPFDENLMQVEISGTQLIVTAGNEDTAVDFAVRAYVDGEEAAFQTFRVNIRNGYWLVSPSELSEEQRNLAMGDTFSIDPVLYEYTLDEDGNPLNPVPVEYVTFDWAEEDMDWDAWEVAEPQEEEDSQENGNLPALIRKTREEAEAILVAKAVNENGELEEVYRWSYWFNRLDYSSELEWSFGSREDSFVFPDGDSLTLTLHTDAPLNKEGYSVIWNVVEYKEDQEVAAECVTWSVSEDGTSITLTGKPDHEGQGCDVSAVVYYDYGTGEDPIEFCREQAWVDVRGNERWLEEYGSEWIFVPGEEIELSYDAEAGGIPATLWVRDNSHPYGEEIPVLITEVTGGKDENGEEVLSITEDETGSVIARGGQNGETVVTLKICDASSENGLTPVDIFVRVTDDYYLSSLWTEGSAVSGFMLPDEELDIKEELYHVFSTEGEPEIETVATGNYKLTYSDYDTDVISVDDAGHITAINRGTAWVKVTFFDTDGEELPGYASRWLEINVTGLYYTVEPAEAIVLEPGADFEELNLVTREIRITAPEGRNVDNAVYEASDWNGNLLEVNSDDGIISVKTRTALTEEDEPVDTFLYVRSSLPGETDALTERRLNVKICCHTWDSGSVEKAATCVSAGTRIHTCTKCGKEKTEPIPATGQHTWDGGKVTTPATCGATGIRTYTCTVCGGTKTEAIHATGQHSYGDYAVTRQATVLAEGVKVHTCRVCGHQESASVPKLTPTIQVNATSVPLKTGQSTTKLKVTGLAAGDSVKSWTSQNTKIVKVSSTGKLTAQKKTGKTTVTITLASGLQKKITVTVQTKKVTTSKISGVSKKLTLKKGANLALMPVITPITTTDKVTYASSNKKVATVSSKGVVTAKAAGTAKITITSGKKKATVTVTVPKTKTTAISGVKSAVSLRVGKTYKLAAKLSPKDSDEKITYSTSNKKVATVDSKGKITAKKAGTATITVKSGSVKVKCVVTVKK